MQIIRTVDEMMNFAEKEVHRPLGFVPTMGSLHEGHLSLLRQSRRDNSFSVVSIFVNPTQFNDPADFDRYPRQTESDIALLERESCDVLFLPDENEIYPVADTTAYTLGKVTSVLEGKHRPGHFNGVASVVRRLFEVVRPDRAYFGLKDYQQFLVIKKLVKTYEIDVDIVGCEIVRDEHGLALSSRNQLLSDEGKAKAHRLVESLRLMRRNSEKKTGEELEQMGRAYLEAFSGVEVEYVAVVNPENLNPLEATKPSGEGLALIAARIEGIRLIDNMRI